ncbi:MAG TPA: non-heme iron oxygenase ferredoxin subunit [Candidatus Obscuribacter sp.]|nr:non-heme iron oxygenase ferredoxin subunit [Candidatus Obscuribacter sp.]MBK9276657.1 non-heme iron oxygenase ferredoxin subunit [Candidatus Obscuribacter sp.]HMY02907.1 non-heme iron oxygenase ferredoxin subunit [Candidatus Obscuribacter sp.]HMY51908.1 non-heme iron oxygenase ferredoxin subunit [Candidatus Obscuribacter sp.]HNA74741.1 non-heme iron oxygenase ferredoxin subunit [Candidatus Obscuribacter sp.]
MTNSLGSVKIARLDEVEPGKVKVFNLGQEAIALCNVDGKIYAVKDVCTHDDGPLGEGELNGCQIECPRHGARFDVTTGKAMSLPAVLPVPTYKVDVQGSDIFVSLE